MTSDVLAGSEMIALSVSSTVSSSPGSFHLSRRRRDLLGERRVVQVSHREVDGDAQPVALGVPARELAERLVEHVAGERLDQAGLLGRRDELARRDQTARRMLPARERLDAGDRARADVELGLVVQHELAVANRARQLREQLEARRVVAVELLVVEGMRRSGLLGHVHRDIGALQEHVDVAAVRGEARHADAGLDVERQAIGLERQLERGEDALERLVEIGRGLGKLADEDAELVAAQPRDRVAAAQHRLETPG